MRTNPSLAYLRIVGDTSGKEVWVLESEDGNLLDCASHLEAFDRIKWMLAGYEVRLARRPSEVC